MNYEVIANSEDRAEWLDARMEGLTATDLSRLANGGPSVWAAVKAEKRGDRRNISSAYIQWGIEREPIIARVVCSTYPVTHNTDLLRSTKDPRILATPDLVDPNGALVGDIKTSVWKGAEWVEPPQAYYDQLQVQMFVTGIHEAILCVEYHEDFVPVSPFPQVLPVAYDEGRMAELVEVAESFLAMGDPSPFDLYLADYARGEELERSGAEIKAAARELIEKEIGDRDSFKFVSDAGSISLTTPKPSSRFDAKALEADDPDLYGRYVRESQGKPRLTIRTEGVA